MVMSFRLCIKTGKMAAQHLKSPTLPRVRTGEFQRAGNFETLFVLIGLLIGCSGERPKSPGATPTAETSEQQHERVAGGSGTIMPEFRSPDLSEQEIRDGWLSLFDGVSLFGWIPSDGTNWRIEQGTIVADGGKPGVLTTPFALDDFELRCDFHLETGGNSGIFLRMAEKVGNPATDTYELNICDSHESHPTGSLVARHRANDVPPVEGIWHTFHVRFLDRRIQVQLDGAEIVDFTDDSDHVRLSGVLGLQMNGGRIAFRNVFVRPFSFRDLFDGESLNGWTVVDGSKSVFEVLDGAIHVTDGPGFVQTESVYEDFLLHVEARVNGDSLNSGVFFRAQTGTQNTPSNGYEMQIQNGYRDGDRTRPTDSGTGAIFRRAAARYVVANDREWLTATLLAQGDYFSTWVNGYPVVSWRDTRNNHENPRKGRRLDAGHISLQGHDPTTDLDFRAVRIHEFSEIRQPNP